MSIIQIGPIPRDQPLIDPKTGKATAVGANWWTALWNRTGQGTGVDASTLISGGGGGGGGGGAMPLGSSTLILDYQVSASPFNKLGTILGRTFDISNYFPFADGATDDTAAFTAAFNDLAAVGGGTLLISPWKRYRVNAFPAMPPNVWLKAEGSSYGNFFSQDFTVQTGVILIPPGTTLSGLHSAGHYYNSAQPRTTTALTPGDGCRISNILFVSTNYFTPVTAVDCERSVFDSSVGMIASGNAIQLDNDKIIIEDCGFIGFRYGVLNTTAYQDVSGNPLGAAGNECDVRSVWGDCVNLLGLGHNGSPRFVGRVQAANMTKPQGVPAQTSIGITLATDGAGGSIATIGTYLSGGSFVPMVWPNAMIGTPVAGHTITISIYDANNIPCVNTADTRTPPSQQIVGTWVSQGGGAFGIELAGLPPTGWFQYGVTTSGGVGNTGATTTPAFMAFTATCYRGGYGLEMLNVNSTIVQHYVGGSAQVHIGGSSNLIWIKSIDQDCGHPDGPAVLIDGNSSVISAGKGHIYSHAIGVWENLTGRPNGCVYLDDIAFSNLVSPLVLQNGDMSLVNCSYGKGGTANVSAIAVGDDAGTMIMTGCRFPTQAADGGTVGFVVSSLAPAPILDENCKGAPLMLVHPPAGTTSQPYTMGQVQAQIGTKIPLQWFENNAGIAGVTASNAASLAYYASVGGGPMTVQTTAGIYLFAGTTPSGATTDAAFVIQQAWFWIAAMNTLALAAGGVPLFELEGAAGYYLCNETLLEPPTGNLFDSYAKNAYFMFSTQGAGPNACVNDNWQHSLSLPRPSNHRRRGGTWGKVGNHYRTDPITGTGTLNGDPTNVTFAPSPILAWQAGEAVGAGWHRSSAGQVYVYNSQGTTGSVAPTAFGQAEFGTAFVDGNATCSFTTRPNVGGIIAAPLYIGTATTPAASNAHSAYSGDIFSRWGDNREDIDITVLHWAHGGKAMWGGGNNWNTENFQAWCPDGATGSGALHPLWGFGHHNRAKGVSGDDFTQAGIFPGNYTNGVGYAPPGNVSAGPMIISNFEVTSLQARALTCDAEISNAKQAQFAATTNSPGSPSATMTFAPAASGSAGDLTNVVTGTFLYAKHYWPAVPNLATVLTITGSTGAGWTVVASAAPLITIPLGTGIGFVTGTPYGSLSTDGRITFRDCSCWSGGGSGIEIVQSDNQGCFYTDFNGIKLDCSSQAFQVACAGQVSPSSTIPFGSASNAWWITLQSTTPYAQQLNVYAYDNNGNNIFAGSNGQVFVLSTSGSVGAGNFAIVISDKSGAFTPSAAIAARTPIFFSLNFFPSNAVQFSAGGYGGCWVTTENLEVFGAFLCPLSIQGNMRNFRDQGSRFYAPQAPTHAVSIGGMLSGGLNGTHFWGSGAVGDIVLTIGTMGSTDPIGEVAPGAASNFTVADCKLFNCANSTLALELAYSTSVQALRNQLVPADASGSQSAQGIAIANTSANCNADFNDCSLLAGTGITTAAGNTIGSSNLAGTVPIVPMNEAATAFFQSAALASGGTLTVSTVVGSSLYSQKTVISLTNATTATGSIVLPHIGANDISRSIVFLAKNAVTALTVSAAGSTNVYNGVTGLAAGSSLTFNSDPIGNAWIA